MRDYQLIYGLLATMSKWNTKIHLHNPVIDLSTLNTPRYSLGQGYSSVCLIRYAIGKVLHLGQGTLLLGLLNLLLLLNISRLHCWRFPRGNLIDRIGTLRKLRFFCLLGKRIPLLKKFVWVAMIVWTYLLNLLKDFFHRRRGSRQLHMPIATIRTIWTKPQLVPATLNCPN